MALSRTILIKATMQTPIILRLMKVDQQWFTDDYLLELVPQSGSQAGVNIASSSNPWAKDYQQGFTHFMDIPINGYFGLWFQLRIKETAASTTETYNFQANIGTETIIFDSGAPHYPVSLASQNVASTSATITWSAPTSGPSATGYKILRSSLSQWSSYSEVGTSTVASFQDTGLTPGTNYWYVIVAVNAVGTGARSDALQITTSNSSATVPDAPVLVLGGVGSTSAALSWQAVSGATGYKLFRSATSASAGWAQIGGILSATSVTDTGLTSGTAYWYRTVAVNAVGDSTYSNVVNPTTTSGTLQTAAPTLTANTGGSICRQQYELRGTAEANATVEVEVGSVLLTATATATGAWEVNPTAWIGNSVTQLRARATAAGKSTSNWSNYVTVVDGTPTDTWAMPFQSGSTYQAFLVTFSGTPAAPTNIVKGALISAAPRATLSEVRADINAYFDSH